MGCTQSADTTARPSKVAGRGAPARSSYAAMKEGYVRQELAREMPGFLKEYALGPMLGEGEYGVVLACTNRTTEKEYAVKFADKRTRQGVKENLRSERLARKVLGEHPNLMRVEACLETKACGVSVLEKVDTRLRTPNGTPHHDKDAVRSILEGIVRGVCHMHDQNVAHLDLKLENVMLATPEGQGVLPEDVKVIDFGSAAAFTEGDSIKSLAGTPATCAPEVLGAYLDATERGASKDDLAAFSEKADVWSIGVMAVMLRTGDHPFARGPPKDLREYLGRISAPYRCVHGDVLFQDFVSRALQVDVAARATVQELLDHPYLRLPLALERNDTDDLLTAYGGCSTPLQGTVPLALFDSMVTAESCDQ
eukprot:TRINITY_DN3008_c2_g1_i1.p1 TRINITY_DN3008_c2_g1~~TRINITY_DN3008_c2_g1_i1.p1  ORF type:complete len:366 (+),score=149.64 TRINITY_DN3008_c2_g1_i1:62-1159(+)